MKVLIINTFDAGGGAARAAYRLHRALLSVGVESYMLVQDKQGDDYTVIGPETKAEKFINLFRFLLDQLPLMQYKKRSPTLFSTAIWGNRKVRKIINKLNPDIVHLHWVAAGMLSVEDIGRIKKPVVWSLHDMWAFTGGCHYDEGCGSYEKKCGKCRVLRSQSEKDISRKVWYRKERVFQKIQNLTIVGLSQWIGNCAKESSLFRGKNVVFLPNPIDTNLFKPFDKEKARKLWNFPSNKRLILFGAMSATSDPRKGFKELKEAFRFLKRNDIELIVFGSGEPKRVPDFGFRVHYVGKLQDEVSLVTLYSAADVMVVPSLQENLSNAIMESLACGTPVVAFDIGGNRDMIEHEGNGYLARPYDVEDLARGIEWVLAYPEYEKLCQHARAKVEKEFSSEIVGRKYMALYQKILGNEK